MDFELKTITDFDFALSPSPNDVVRVAVVQNDVSTAEVNLILWLILEREFGLNEVDTSSKLPLQIRTQCDGGGNLVNVSDIGQDSSDFVDSSSIPFSRRQRRKSISQQHKARKYAEQLLREVGIDLPFDKLSATERKNLFNQFSASSQLLKSNTFGSVLDLFEALRTRSKLKSEFFVIKEIGRGNYGEVFAVSHKKSGLVFAAKRISLTINCIEEIKMTLNESSLLKKLTHPNIVQCHDAWLEMEYDPKSYDDDQEPLKFYVLMDYCTQSLNEWIQETRFKPEEASILRILKQIVHGVEYIHLQGILHLDINTKNILWADSERTILKIGDFGLAIKGDHFNDRTGTVPYSAPETFQTQKSDMYSVGVTMFEIGESILTVNELCDRLRKRDVSTGFQLLDNILTSLLDTDPIKRLSATQVMQILNV